jgi:hypothetical protein
MAFQYITLYNNGLNSNSQIRRSTDMIYQRGATYQIVLSGTTYEASMQLQVDLYAEDNMVGKMDLVPYDISQSGSTYTYKFNLRPYDYISNYIQSQHYTGYTLNDWITTKESINDNNPYPNSVKANFKFGYKYINSTGQTIQEFSGNTVNNDFTHYTLIPNCVTNNVYTPSGFTNTGKYFDYIGGQLQMDEKFFLPNFDQELGTVIGTGLTINNTDLYRLQSPTSQFLMTYPKSPYQSENGRFMTNAPRIQYIQSDENYVLYFLNGQTGDRQVIEANQMYIEYYDETNLRLYKSVVPIAIDSTVFNSPSGYTQTLQPYAFPCGPIDIDYMYNNYTAASTLFTTGLTVNWDEVAYYTVQLCNYYPTNYLPNYNLSVGSPVSEPFYFYINENCQPENTRLAWLNAAGGYDYFTFTSYRQDTKKISRQTYDSRYYATDLASADRDYGRSVKTFAQDVDREIVLESDYLSVAYGAWLQELFLSPQVYEMKPDYISTLNNQSIVYKDMRPLQILSTEVETITKKHRKLNKYRITVKRADTFFANRGF